MKPALICQLPLLIYHQTTTWMDLYFNGGRNYTTKERVLEAGTNGVLMSLAPIGMRSTLHL